MFYLVFKNDAYKFKKKIVEELILLLIEALIVGILVGLVVGYYFYRKNLSIKEVDTMEEEF